VFLLQEYDFDVSRAPRTIVDAGANIGLASIYFANRYPDAKIIAIEAERSNFEVLQRNVSPYANIVPVHAALWSENGSIDLVDPGLGKWGFMTQRADGSEKTYGRVVHAVRAMTVDAVLKEHGVDRLDILKIDIEGAEREVFRDPSSWIGKVDALIVELHERMKSGCNRNFYNGSNGFDDEWLQGENVYLTRSRGCVVRRSV
jgi:FkbM family methyltransferase